MGLLKDSHDATKEAKASASTAEVKVIEVEAAKATKAKR